MPEFESFGKIFQLKNTLYLMNKGGYSGDFTFVGRVKLHGTNAAIGCDPETGELYAQSRSRVLSLESDNFGFAAYVASLQLDIKPQRPIFGEWVGPGIQKNVALAELKERMFVAFNELPIIAVVSINAFEEHSVLAAQEYIHQKTMEVEEECPFAKEHGISGTGEGLVWRCAGLPREFWFKSKGQKHSKSNVKESRKPAIDAEQLKSIGEFLDWAAGEDQLSLCLQAQLSAGNEPVIQNIGPFIKYTVTDIMAECSLELEALGVPIKEVAKRLGHRAAAYYRSKL